MREWIQPQESRVSLINWPQSSSNGQFTLTSRIYVEVWHMSVRPWPYTQVKTWRVCAKNKTTKSTPIHVVSINKFIEYYYELHTTSLFKQFFILVVLVTVSGKFCYEFYIWKICSIMSNSFMQFIQRMTGNVVVFSVGPTLLLKITLEWFSLYNKIEKCLLFKQMMRHDIKQLIHKLLCCDEFIFVVFLLCHIIIYIYIR